ncbi:hypothetical protein [Sphaerimonospora thailandensis]|uniref:Uncharacterized protein n=1 Tax=Sphaerimonospora thailandensis TaxID=795644 RepID=A0A8J3R8C4_9ACTN|nr:hypothetical protein [Sphaerimonospora thailandensis]GIH70343.1 hypothetical protein Mth01_25960 [Sphaerimonospora thailandensis]
MATRTPQAITVGGITPTYHAATAATGDKVKAGDRTFIHVRNGAGAPVTVTFSGVGKTSYQEDLPDKAYTVAASGELLIPVLPSLGDSEDGSLATFVCSAAADVTFAALRI